MEKGYTGLHGLPAALGVVEDRFDPLHLGRCKVRYFGWHVQDKKECPTKDLPWSIPLKPLNSGESAKPPLEGDYILGFFLDGQVGQEPVMVGKFTGFNTEKSKGPDHGFFDARSDGLLMGHKVPDVLAMVAVGNEDNSFTEERPKKERYPRIRQEPTTNRLERPEYPVPAVLDRTVVKLKRDIAEENVVKVGFAPIMIGKPGYRMPASPSGSTMDEFKEPNCPYGARYPYNFSYCSESGHVLEIDDTPGKERIHWYHRSGSFQEIHPSGLEVHKTVQSRYDYISADHYCHIGNLKVVTTNQGYKIKVNDKGVESANFTLLVGPNGNINLTAAKGQINIYAQEGDCNICVNGNATTYVEKDYNLRVNGNFNIAVNGYMTQTVDKYYSQVTKGNKTEIVRGTFLNILEGYSGIHYSKDNGPLPAVNITYAGNVETKYQKNYKEDTAGNFTNIISGIHRHDIYDYELQIRNNAKLWAKETVDILAGTFTVSTEYLTLKSREFKAYARKLISLITSVDMIGGNIGNIIIATMTDEKVNMVAPPGPGSIVIATNLTNKEAPKPYIMSPLPGSLYFWVYGAWVGIIKGFTRIVTIESTTFKTESLLYVYE
jgi:hypothetical protein